MKIRIPGVGGSDNDIISDNNNETGGNLGVAKNPDWLYSNELVIHALPGWYNDPEKTWIVTATSTDTKEIIVRVNGQNPITVPVRNGEIQWTPSPPLNDGEYTLTFTPVDFTGNVGEPLNVAYNVDTIAPNKPLITAIEDYVNGGVQDGNSIKRNGYTNDANPVVRGEAEANSLVYIYNKNNKTPLASVKANSRGEWEIEVHLPKDGTYELTAVAEDRADNRSQPSLKWSFELDTVNPDGATINYYFDDVGLNRGQFDFSRPTDDRRPELHGTGEPGEFVRVQYASKNGAWTTTPTVTVDSNGKWEWTPPKDLSDGEWSFRVRGIDHAGNVSKWSGSTTLVVDSSIAQPTIVQAIDDVGPISNVSPGQTTDDARLDFSGKAEANSVVTLYLEGFAVGSTQANVNGDWSITPQRDMREGLNNFSVKAVDEAGNESNDSANYPVNFKPVPQYERNSEDWESRGKDNWATGQTYTYGKLKVTELKHGNSYNGWHTGIMANVKTHTGYYNGKTVSMLNNSIVKYDFGETDYVAFNYANLHNHSTQVKIFAPNGELISTQTLAYSGTINNESSSAKFSYQASGNKPIGYIEVHSSVDPSLYWYNIFGWVVKTTADVGWSIDTMTWGSGEVSKINTVTSTDSNPIYAPTPGEIHIIDVATWMISTQPLHPELASNVIFDGANQNIDFAAVGERVDGMQKIDITGKGNNVLNLDLKALLTEGGNGLFISDSSKQFMIDGNAGDRVALDRDSFSDGWLISQNKVQVGGENWTLLTNNKENYTLLVNQEIDIVYG
jgi:hypothetical protein